eukprot:11431097-Alexandrium_andersonii.AAC.1
MDGGVVARCLLRCKMLRGCVFAGWFRNVFARMFGDSSGQSNESAQRSALCRRGLKATYFVDGASHWDV